jgi:sulfur carrier protein
VEVRANGKAYPLSAPLSVAAFIRARGLDPAYVVVELNGEALHRKQYEGVVLRDGDRLELVRAVAGG